MSASESAPRSDEDRRLRVQITEDDLLCVNRCGFYGTPQLKGLCSQCWRTYQTEEKRQQDFAKNKSLLSFDKFEEKRKSASDSRSISIKSLLRKSSTPTYNPPSIDEFSSSASATSPSGTPSRHRHISADSAAAREAFTRFLTKNFPHHSTIAQKIFSRTERVVEKLNILTNHQMDDLSEAVQNFYHMINEELNRNPVMINNEVKVTAEEVMENIEQYLCVRAYNALFCSRTDEEVADLSLQDRIRSLHWVTAGFLETSIDFSRQSVVDKLDDAVTELIDINSKRGAADKLACLVRCSKFIFEALKDSRSGAPASADEYLPVLIFVILKGNPPLIQSNLKFISRFALPSRVMSGESGYYFTNLSCALQFVQNMNADSLKMERAEFEAYTSGSQAPPLNESNCGCNQSIRSMENSLAQLRQLKTKSDEVSSRIDQFTDVTTRHHEKVMTEVRELQERCRACIEKNRLDDFPIASERVADDEKSTENSSSNKENEIEKGEEPVDDLILFCEDEKLEENKGEQDKTDQLDQKEAPVVQ